MLASYWPGVDWLACTDERLIATAIDLLDDEEDDEEDR